MFSKKSLHAEKFLKKNTLKRFYNAAIYATNVHVYKAM